MKMAPIYASSFTEKWDQGSIQHGVLGAGIEVGVRRI